jgi:hypothetical protein
MDPTLFSDLTFWQMVLLVVVALPVIAIVLIASAAIVGFVLWWTIKIAFFGAILLLIIMAFVAVARMAGVA